jgi:hypothetical protein
MIAPMNPGGGLGGHAGFAQGAGWRSREFEEMTMKARNQTAKKDKANGSSTQTTPVPPDFAAYPREELVAVAAYYRAERRGFAPNDEISDWLEAEAEVESLLKTIH